MNKLRLICEDIMNLKGFVLLFDQDVLIELLYEFNVLQLALVSYVHQRLSVVDVDNGHWDGVTHGIEEEQHHSVADFELSQVLVIENVEHLVGLQAPDSVGALFSVFCHDFTVQLVELNEVRPLKHEICE